MAGRIAFVLKGYPRLSETFIAQEIAALEGRGFDLALVSLRHPTDRHTHPVHGRIKAAILYLPEYLYREPLRVLSAWLRVRRWPSYAAVRRLWLSDLARDPTPNRIRRFGQALVLANELDPAIVHFHAHFLHTPTSVARYAAQLTGKRFSISAHAKDIWTIPDWEKREKLADAAFAVTCTAHGAAHLAVLAPPDRVALAYHGLDLAEFPPRPTPSSRRDGSKADDPVILLSVGRAVAKKGYDVLLEALSRLPKELAWRMIHIGGGKLVRRLKRQARRLGLDDRIDWRGARPRPEVLAALREADLFVLASRVAEDGDRDGLPNVLMEAASQGLAAVATSVAAIPEFVVDGTTGRLVPPGDSGALAEATAGLIRDPEIRRRLGAAANERVRADFGFAAGIDIVARKLEHACASPSTRP
ncbi:MAG: glycosyltransferase family 4 protein [Alphaproteobacteria bacterium]|nr:glycosyltransferase family 4 protein [Alphaproteobacteria bacterium]